MVVANAYKNNFRYAPIIFISITYHSKKGRADRWIQGLIFFPLFMLQIQS